MDEKPQPDLLSQLLPDALEQTLGLSQPPEDGQEDQDLLAQRVKTLAGMSGGPLQAAVQEFLEGRGELHASAQAATRGSAVSEAGLAGLLVEKFGLAPALAKILATLLVKLFPSTAKTAKKPRRKPKAAARPKAESSTSRKKPKKKAAAKPKKPSAAKTTKKPAAKKPAAKKPAAKKPAAKRPAAKRPAAKRKTRAPTE